MIGLPLAEAPPHPGHENPRPPAQTQANLQGIRILGDASFLTGTAADPLFPRERSPGKPPPSKVLAAAILFA